MREPSDQKLWEGILIQTDKQAFEKNDYFCDTVVLTGLSSQIFYNGDCGMELAVNPEHMVLNGSPSSQ